jgi:hypothetical protein
VYQLDEFEPSNGVVDFSLSDNGDSAAASNLVNILDYLGRILQNLNYYKL